MAGAEAGGEAGAKAGAEAAAIAARKTATETLMRALALTNGTTDHVINIYGNGSVAQKAVSGGTTGAAAAASAGANAKAPSKARGASEGAANGTTTSAAGAAGSGKTVTTASKNTTASTNSGQPGTAIDIEVQTASGAVKPAKPAGGVSRGKTVVSTIHAGFGEPQVSIAGSYVNVLSQFASHSVRAANGANPSVLARYFVDPQGMADKCKFRASSY